tara:strand:+ start:3357 stop:3500 length:144 start_codon:yes stop_codon:yes gene_type:complete
MSISDFDTFEDYVRHRETYGYTEEEMDKLLAILEREPDYSDYDFELL